MINRLELFIDVDMLMVEKGGISLTIHQYAKRNYKYMKDFD